MQTVRLELPRPHAGQNEIIKNTRRFNVLACGRRFGKTELLINRLIRPAMKGLPVAWFAPNEKYFDEAWRQAIHLLAPVTSRPDSQKKRLELVTGGSLDYWTLHNTDDPGRGRKYARVGIDEAAIVPTHRLRRQWQEAIRPTLTDYEGDAWFASTPKGAGFFKDLFDRNDPEWISWQKPTSDNPFISTKEIEAARLELPPLVFAQEYLAQFVSDIGGQFKQPARYQPDALPREGFTEATGCDFAYTSKAGDWTVFLRGRRKGDTLYVTDAYRQQAETNEWAERLKLEPRPFALIGGQEKGITQLLGQFGITIDTKPAAADKRARAQAVAAAWNRGDVQLPTDAPWLDDVLPEILSFTGDPRVDTHDDCVDALAALWHQLFESEPQIFV